ncbi:MAG: mechanosensitive ion channel [Desulfobacterium sp.]|nr:mechanosensitive ion channel [Desulfobacterium sp.]
MAGFREQFNRPEASRKAGDRIQSATRQLKRRRQRLNRPIRAGFKEKLQALHERRYTVEDTLFSLNDRWQETLDEAVKGLSEKEIRDFTPRTESLGSDFRTALREEKSLLTEVITLGQQFQSLSARRLDNIGEHERFIRSRVFWLQDIKPMGIDAMKPTGDEALRLLKWLRNVASGEKGAEILYLVKRPMALLTGLLLLLAGPAVLFFLWRRFRQAVSALETRAVPREVSLVEKAVLIFASVAGPAVIMAYCLLLARFMGNSGLPGEVKAVMVVTLEQTGYFLFLWCMSKTLLGAHGLLPIKFHMHKKGARALYTSLRQLLYLYISWLLLWRILTQPPFAFEALPRICYTIFELLGAMVIVRLIRPVSPWVRHSVDTASANLASAYWPWISRLFMLLTVSIIFLDLTGYRYGAQSIARSSGLSLVTLMLFPSVYTAITAYIGSMERWRNRDPGTSLETVLPPYHQVLRVVEAAFIILLLILVAVYWGIDQQALKTLEEIHLYKMRGAGEVLEFVTAADLIRAGLFLTATFLMLRWLPGLYEFALMPRLRLDEGMKYAVLTLCRYGIFIVGLLLTLAEIHLDLGRLGWLMAAMGVGIGFGLQEIVSNFVSGIILLTERPIQVNDVVTVGGITGTIRRINIRATTLVNFDRQEVIIPNRSLITSEVTNWTKSDTINRLVIKIGVAYGSDVEKVAKLLKEIALASTWVLKEPSPLVVFIQHGDSSLDFELRVFTPSPDNRMETLNHINKEINRHFDEQGIEIPFPQRDLHIRSGTI